MAFKNSLTSALSVLISFVPKVIAFLIVVLVGWWIVGLIGRGLKTIFRKARINHLAARSGFEGFVNKVGMKADAATIAADIIKWLLGLVVLMAAFDALGLPVLSQLFSRFLLWTPNLIIALTVLVLGVLFSRVVAGLARSAAARSGLEYPNVIAMAARVAIISLAIIIAANQIDVGETLVNTLFIGFVGMLALAIGLAFGLGGHETAKEIIQAWYRKGKDVIPRMKAAATELSRQRDLDPPDGSSGS